MGIRRAAAVAGRVLIPRRMRVLLRRIPLLRGIARRVLGGTAAKPYPASGFTFYFDAFRNVGFLAHDLGSIDAHSMQTVRKLLADARPGCMWDVGANIGFWSLFFSTLKPAPREIRSYEPDVENLEYLRMNRERNALSWVIRSIGLSDNAGAATFYADPLTGATGSLESDWNFIGRHYHAQRRIVSIELSTIDAEVAQGAAAPDFLKIDVEGHELHVLRGGEKTLRRLRPPIILEVTRQHAEIAALLRDYGYALYDEHANRLERPEFTTLALPR